MIATAMCFWAIAQISKGGKSVSLDVLILVLPAIVDIIAWISIASIFSV